MIENIILNFPIINDTTFSILMRLLDLYYTYGG